MAKSQSSAPSQGSSKGGHAVHPVIQGLAGTGPAPLVVNPVVVAATLHLAHVN